jgi:hypothetical protein
MTFGSENWNFNYENFIWIQKNLIESGNWYLNSEIVIQIWDPYFDFFKIKYIYLEWKCQVSNSNKTFWNSNTNFRIQLKIIKIHISNFRFKFQIFKIKISNFKFQTFKCQFLNSNNNFQYKNYSFKIQAIILRI